MVLTQDHCCTRLGSKSLGGFPHQLGSDPNQALQVAPTCNSLLEDETRVQGQPQLHKTLSQSAEINKKPVDPDHSRWT